MCVSVYSHNAPDSMKHGQILADKKEKWLAQLKQIPGDLSPFLSDDQGPCFFSSTVYTAMRNVTYTANFWQNYA